MLTTTQVRAIMRTSKSASYGIYTNKTAGCKTLDRRVKCYYCNDDQLLNALVKAAGANNVTLTADNGYGVGAGITVKCVLG